MRFFQIFLSLPLFLILTYTNESVAAAKNPPPLHIQTAVGLFEKVMPAELTAALKNVPLRQIQGDGAPLARYRPRESVIEIGSNFDNYRAEYTVLSSNQDKAFRPDFDHYLGVLTALSFANEITHVMQHRSKSLDDFYTAMHRKDYKYACDIYGLQQFASDVVMMQAAYRLEYYFLGLGSAKGINAVSVALEKMGIKSVYEQYRAAVDKRDDEGIGYIYLNLFQIRQTLNMEELKFCNPSGDMPRVPQDVDARIGVAVGMMNRK